MGRAVGAKASVGATSGVGEGISTKGVSLGATATGMFEGAAGGVAAEAQAEVNTRRNKPRLRKLALSLVEVKRVFIIIL